MGDINGKSSIFHNIIIDTPQKACALLDALKVSKQRTVCTVEPVEIETDFGSIAEEAV